jgi:long-chain fatty acid transport protein
MPPTVCPPNYCLNKKVFKIQWLKANLLLFSMTHNGKFAGMPTSTGLRAALLLSCFFLLPATSYPGVGFGRGFPDTRSAAMGTTVTGISLNAASAFYNPAAMTFLEKSQVAGGLSMSMFDGSYLSPYTGNTDMDSKLLFPFHLYAAVKTGERSAAGVSINTPFNQNIAWPDDWTGRYIVKEIRTRATYIQSSFAYQFSETFSGSVGAIVSLGNHYLARDLEVGGPNGDVGMELEAGMIGFGFDVALFFKPTDEFSLGLNYRSAVKLTENNGDASFSNVPSSLSGQIPSSTSFDTEITLPASVNAGASYAITRELLMSLDLGYTFWNVYDNVAYDFEEQNLDFDWSKNYQNTFSMGIGVRFITGDLLDLCGGIGYISSAVEDESASPADMQNETFHFSLGTTFHFGKNTALDLGYQLMNIREREAYNDEFEFGGNYKTQMNNFGLTFSYLF